MKTTSQTTAAGADPGSDGPCRISAADRYRGYVDFWDQQELAWRGLSDIGGALVGPDGRGYPVRDGVARFVNDRDPADDEILARIGVSRASGGETQGQESVDRFGCQWNWDNKPRTGEDLLWRVAERFNPTPGAFAAKRVLDAGCGAGAQSRFLANAGAVVSAVDLSSAINSAARVPELRRARLAQADIAHLPFPPASFEIVYCEGVLQHTAAIEPILEEFARVLEPGGILLATHYLSPQGLLRRARWTTQEWLRGRAQRIFRDWLFLASGLAAAAAFSPGIGLALAQGHRAGQPENAESESHLVEHVRLLWPAQFPTLSAAGPIRGCRAQCRLWSNRYARGRGRAGGKAAPRSRPGRQRVLKMFGLGTRFFQSATYWG